jgi:hypothetical protein
MTDKGWLTQVGQEELRLTRELGWDHPETIAARQKWSETYKAVQSIRRSYENPPAEKDNG